MTTTISEAGAHAAAAATDRIPAIKSPYDATGRGYTTPLQIVSGLAYVDVASATTTDIGAVASDKVRITGTTTITSLGTVAAGTLRSVRFAAALTLTHNGTSLILPGSANIITTADDTAMFVSLGSGNWICTNYQRIANEAYTNTASAASIAAVGNAINTTNKYAGRVVFDTTNTRLMVASGSAAAAAWYVADGSASVTPS